MYSILAFISLAVLLSIGILLGYFVLTPSGRAHLTVRRKSSIFVAAGVVVLEIAQFFVFPCNEVPALSVALGLPVFSVFMVCTVVSFLLWKERSQERRLIHAAIFVGGSGALLFLMAPPWLLTHMCG